MLWVFASALRTSARVIKITEAVTRPSPPRPILSPAFFLLYRWDREEPRDRFNSDNRKETHAALPVLRDLEQGGRIARRRPAEVWQMWQADAARPAREAHRRNVPADD